MRRVEEIEKILLDIDVNDVFWTPKQKEIRFFFCLKRLNKQIKADTLNDAL